MECGSTLHINSTYKYRFQPKKNNISYFKGIPLIWYDVGNTMTLLFFFTICINISYFLGHWFYKGQWVHSIINIGFNLWIDFGWILQSVSMSSCGYGHGVSPCFHVDTDRVSPCLHVDRDTECLHVSMCVSMSPCGYGHGVSPCPHVDMDMKCLHVSMWIQTQSVSVSACG